MKTVSKIRKAKPSEADILTELTLSSKAYWGYSESFMESCTSELTVTSNKLTSEDFHYWVAEENSSIIGYYAVRKMNANEFEMEGLFVDPEFIGKGIGKILMDHAKKFVKKLGGKSINIQSDPNAEKFYLMVGGVRVGSKPSGSIQGRSLPMLRVDL